MPDNLRTYLAHEGAVAVAELCVRHMSEAIDRQSALKTAFQATFLTLIT
jgi:hypothetical protein